MNDCLCRLLVKYSYAYEDVAYLNVVYNKT